MIIVEKNHGQKIDYEVNKTKLTFDDDLTLNLAKREEDYAVHIDVCFDEDGALCIECDVVAKFGAPVFELGKTLQDVVKSSVESVTGLTVQQVNVNICGVALPREAKK